MLKKHFQYKLTMFGFEIRKMDKCCVCGKQLQMSGMQTRRVCEHNKSMLLLHSIHNAHGLHTHCRQSICETGTTGLSEQPDLRKGS